MPYWKWLVIVGLALSFVGTAILTWMGGVPWVMPTRPMTTRDVWRWRGAFALMALGNLLELVGASLSPS